MGTTHTLAAIAFAAALFTCSCHGCKSSATDHQLQTAANTAAHPQNCSDYALRSADLDPCPYAACGMNGFWLGQGVKFREIMLDGTSNDAGLVVTDFRSEEGARMRLDVEGDQLLGYPVFPGVGPAKKGSDLKGSVITLAPEPGTTDRRGSATHTYHLKITDVTWHDFWADPECSASPKDCPAPGQATIYSFEATSDDGCPVMTCTPDLAKVDAKDFSGKALIFRGDEIDNDYRVSRPAPKSTNDNFFNIACEETIPAKVHLLRRTVASRPHFELPPPEAEQTKEIADEQTLVRLLAGDYCGAASPLTNNGVPIDLQFRHGLQPTPASRYQKDASDTLDAVWDANGAVCLGSPRLANSVTPLLKWWATRVVETEIQSKCSMVQHALPVCSDMQPPATISSPFVLDATLASFNPPPPAAP